MSDQHPHRLGAEIGAKRMCRELSAEARAMVLEWQQKLDDVEPGSSSDDDIAALESHLFGMVLLAHRLGLDLNEQEDVSQYNGDPLDFADVDLNEQDGDA